MAVVEEPFTFLVVATWIFRELLWPMEAMVKLPDPPVDLEVVAVEGGYALTLQEW